MPPATTDIGGNGYDPRYSSRHHALRLCQGLLCVSGINPCSAAVWADAKSRLDKLGWKEHNPLAGP